MQILNDFAPWRGTLRGQLTVAELLQARTLSPETAATLWWTMQHGASVFVTAGPPGAGKSTVANALLEFLPEHASVYVTAGGRDRLEIPAANGPVYVLVNELSAHMPVYLYGAAAQRAFELLRAGLRMVGTLHARSAAEAVRVMCDAADLQPAEIATPFVFAAMFAGWSGGEIVRRVAELGFLSPDGELSLLTSPSPEGLSLRPDGLQVLADWSNLRLDVVQSAIAERARQLATIPSRH